MRLNKIAYFTTTCMFLSLASSAAFADDCSDLDKNPAWVSGYKKLEQAIQENNDKQILLYGEALLEVCPRLPKLNYMMAQVYKRQGDEAKTLYYLQNSTRYTKEFVIDTTLLEQMWTERVFAENPDSRPENVKRIQAENEELKASNQKLLHSLDLVREGHSNFNVAVSDANKLWGTLMWSGVGVSAVGLASLVAGAVMIGTMDKPLVFDDGVDHSDKSVAHESQYIRAKIKGKYGTAWALIGAGIGITVVGAGVTGFAGYYYTRTDDVAISVSPGGFSVSGTF